VGRCVRHCASDGGCHRHQQRTKEPGHPTSDWDGDEGARSGAHERRGSHRFLNRGHQCWYPLLLHSFDCAHRGVKGRCNSRHGRVYPCSCGCPSLLNRLPSLRHSKEHCIIGRGWWRWCWSCTPCVVRVVDRLCWTGGEGCLASAVCAHVCMWLQRSGMLPKKDDGRGWCAGSRAQAGSSHSCRAMSALSSHLILCLDSLSHTHTHTHTHTRIAHTHVVEYEVVKV
jgi:hypothetical protein